MKRTTGGVKVAAAPVLALCMLLAAAAVAGAAPKSEPWARWEANDPASHISVDHGPWDRFLKQYVITNDPAGVNRLRYATVKEEDRRALAAYLKGLAETKVSALTRGEQKAYWINFYNALTVQVVLDHYPVKSIRDIDISPGLFSSGPWKKKLVTVETEPLSLNDIEHRILRPIWRDSRVHYAVNCASLGCPNLQPEAYTAENAERLLETGAREYVNHARGVRVEKGRLHLSSIYDWFKADFGGSDAGVREHLRGHAAEELAREIDGAKGRIKYDYDWSINE